MNIRVAFVLLCLGLSLCACGPKVVGEDAATFTPSGGLSAAQDPSHLRYPSSGRALDKALYYFSMPQVMQANQQNLETFLQKNYTSTDPDKNATDYTNLQPRQASPFRQ